MDPRVLLIAAVGVGLWFTGSRAVKCAKKAKHAVACHVFKTGCEVKLPK